MNREMPTNAVKAVIKDNQGRVLFLKRNKAIREDDQWDLPGGLIDDGEIPLQALEREVYEETGMTISENSGIIGVWSFNRPKDGRDVKVTNYLVNVMSDLTIRLSDEHSESGFFSKEEALKLRVKDDSIYDAL